MKSVMQKERECFICKVNYDVTTTEELKKKIILNKPGAFIYLCPRHNNFDKYPLKYKDQLNLELKQLAETKLKQKKEATN